MIEHQIALSFINLIEVKFINAFSKYGVAVRSIRHMAEEAKRILNHRHPFATKMIFRTDGRKIFIETAEKTGDKKLYDLRGKNWGIYDVLMDALKKDVIYGPAGVATGWYPRKAFAPNVVLHPKVAFGQPVLEESGVPVEALYEAYRAEGEDIDKRSALVRCSRKTGKGSGRFPSQASHPPLRIALTKTLRRNSPTQWEHCLERRECCARR